MHSIPMHFVNIDLIYIIGYSGKSSVSVHSNPFSGAAVCLPTDPFGRFQVYVYIP